MCGRYREQAQYYTRAGSLPQWICESIDFRGLTQIPVGVSLLTKALGQPGHQFTDLTPSRAGSLPQDQRRAQNQQTPRLIVGASLLAKALDQSALQRLNDRLREQARSLYVPHTPA